MNEQYHEIEARGHIDEIRGQLSRLDFEINQLENWLKNTTPALYNAEIIKEKRVALNEKRAKKTTIEAELAELKQRHA